MSALYDALSKTKGEHALALHWFRDQTGMTVSWSEIQTNAEKGARLVNQAKGIYKPHYSDYEPPRVCRRPFGLSYAAMVGCSSMA
jgi:putative restriction endonuclease